MYCNCLIGIVYTPSFDVFVGYSPGTRLYLKPSLRMISSLRPKTI